MTDEIESKLLEELDKSSKRVMQDIKKGKSFCVKMKDIVGYTNVREQYETLAKLEQHRQTKKWVEDKLKHWMDEWAYQYGFSDLVQKEILKQISGESK